MPSATDAGSGAIGTGRGAELGDTEEKKTRRPWDHERTSGSIPIRRSNADPNVACLDAGLCPSPEGPMQAARHGGPAKSWNAADPSAEEVRTDRAQGRQPSEGNGPV